MNVVIVDKDYVKLFMVGLDGGLQFEILRTTYRVAIELSCREMKTFYGLEGL